jgi:hypothetical protein
LAPRKQCPCLLAGLEHHWLRLCYARLGPLFPYLPKQPGYHKRLKAAGPLLAAAMDFLAREAPSNTRCG